MTSGRRHTTFGAKHGLWAGAARLLTLVLALSLLAPAAGWAADAAFHADHERTSLIADGHGDDEADPCVALHLHCCSHQAVSVSAVTAEPGHAIGRTVYRVLDVAVAKVFSERLPKPPRA